MAGESALTIAEAFAEGIRRFNAGEYFEAHEAWESAWLRSEGRERLFYHGLIQAAAACVHLQHSRRKGAQLLYAKSHDKLQHFQETFLGLEIGTLNAALAALFGPVCAEPPETPLDGPALVAQIPQIQWTPASLSEPVAPGSAGTQSAYVKDESHGRPAGSNG